MVTTRINRPTAVPVTNDQLDRVQKALSASLSAITASPTLDSQVLTQSIQGTTSAQAVTFSHQLGRLPVGMHIVACSGLITASGAQSFTRTTATITIQTSAAVSGGTLTVAVF